MKTILAVILSAAAMCSAVPFEPRYYGSPYDPIFPYDFGIRRNTDERENLHKVKKVSAKKDTKHVSNKKQPESAGRSMLHAVESAEKAVLHAVEGVEHAVEKAVHDEVDTLFHGHENHKEMANVSAKDKKAAFVRGKDKPSKKEEHHHHHEFKPEMEESLRECMSGDIE